MSKIFVSYARENSACVEQIVRRIEAQGFPVWFDQLSIPGGEDWREAIRQGVAESDIALVMCSPAAMASHYVGEEVKRVLNKQIDGNMRLIPVLVEQLPIADLPDDLRALNIIDASDCTGHQIKQIIERLNQVAEHLRRKPVSDFAPDKPLDDYTPAYRYHDDLVAVSYMPSVYCHAYILGAPDISVKDVLAQPNPVAQLALQFFGAVDDDQFIERVYRSARAFNETHGAEVPFFALHIKGPANGPSLALRDRQTGEWLDAINLTCEAATSLFGRGKALLQIFNLAPASLTVGLGRSFTGFWHFQMFNFVRDDVPDDQRYVLVADTREL